MSQLPSSLPTVRRNVAPNIHGRVGAVSSTTPALGQALAQPGGADLRASRQLDALQQWLGMGGQVAGQLTRRAERAAAEEEALQRGQAAEAVATELPLIQQQVQSGELDFLFDGDGEVKDDVDAYVNQLVEREMGDAPEAFVEQYRRQMTPRLMQLVVGRENEMIARERSELSRLAQESGVVAENAGQVREAVKAWRSVNPDASEDEAIAEVVIPAARSAARLGHDGREQLEVAMGVLGDRFPGEQRLIREEFDAAVRQNQRLREDDLRRAMPSLTQGEPTPEMFATRLNRQFGDFDEARRQQVVEQYTRDRIVSAAQLGEPEKMLELAAWLDDTDANNAFVRQQMDRAFPAIRQEFAAQRLTETVDDLLPVALDWRRAGGLPEAWAQLGGDTITFDVGGGEQVEITRQQVEQAILPAARQQMIEQVRQAMPNASDAEVGAAFEQQWLGFLGGNGLADPTIRQRVSGVASSLGGIDDEEQVPARAVGALDFYQRGIQTHPRVVRQHMNEADVELMQRATRIQQMNDVSPGQALIRAHRNIEAPAPSNVTTSMIDEAVQQVMFIDRLGPFNDQAVNEQHVFDYLRSAVQDGVQDTGYSAEAVLEGVLEDFEDDFTLINGHWVNTSTVGMADDVVEKIPFDALGTAVAEHFTAANPAEGYEAGDLTIAPDGLNPNQWRLRDARGYAVPDSPVLTLQDMVELSQFFTGEQMWRESEATVREQAEKRVSQMRLTKIRQWRSEQLDEFYESASLIDRVLKRGLSIEPSEQDMERIMADVPSVDELFEQRMQQLQRPEILDDPVLGPIAEMIRSKPDRERREAARERYRRRRDVHRSHEMLMRGLAPGSGAMSR